MGELLGAGESPDGCVLVGDALQIALPVASFAGRQLFCRLDPVGRLDEAGVYAVDADLSLTSSSASVFENIISAGLRRITADYGGLRADYGDAISNPHRLCN